MKKIFKQYLPLFKKMLLFKKIADDDILNMLTCIKPLKKHFQKGEALAIEGHKFNSLGVLLEGKAMVLKDNWQGNRLMLTMIEPGDVFGEIAVFSARERWPASVEAKDNSVVIYLPKSKILGECEKLCSWHRVMIQNFLEIVSERALMFNKKVEYLMLKSIREKICAYLWDQYQLLESKSMLLSLNRNQLADFLNVSRPSLSREMKKLKDEGIIDFYLSSIKLINLEALRN